MRVFIVDDSAIVRSHVASLSTGVDGVEVVGQAGTAAEALAGIPALQPDFVILDFQLPDADGLAVLHAVQQLDHVPLVGMLTNHPLARRVCVDARANFFWDKSRDFADIPAVLRAVSRGPTGAQHAW